MVKLANPGSKLRLLWMQLLDSRLRQAIENPELAFPQAFINDRVGGLLSKTSGFANQFSRLLGAQIRR